MRAAIILNDTVLNVIEVETLDAFQPDEGTLVLATDATTLGGRYVNGVFLPPLPPSNAAQAAQRQALYESTTDSMFFKTQRDELPLSDWLAAVEAVKARFPYYYDENGTLLS
jgi:hypothetical protein